MAIGQAVPKAVSGIKRTRTTKQLTSKVVGIKITELIEKLPTQEERDHALKVFHALVAPVKAAAVPSDLT